MYRSGIYKIEFSDGKFYIGESRNIDSRWFSHREDMRAGKHINKLVADAYRECGEPVFSRLEQACVDDLKKVESKWVTANRVNPLLLNYPHINSKNGWDYHQQNIEEASRFAKTSCKIKDKHKYT